MVITIQNISQIQLISNANELQSVKQNIDSIPGIEEAYQFKTNISFLNNAVKKSFSSIFIHYSSMPSRINRMTHRIVKKYRACL